jgi:outer membrane receptor protein involved in Fe transport
MKLRLLVVFILLSATLLVGQTFRGTVLGSVTDPSGAYVAGATVKVRNAATGIERTTVTSADGSYRVPELPIGTYAVTVSQSGFQTAVTNDVEVNVATERRVDAQLKTGQVTQTVEVSGGDLAQIETTSNDLGGVLTSKGVADLPINGRDYTKLIFLNPGVAGSPDQITDSPGSFGEFSMNGARGRSNNYMLDGTDMNDGYRNDPAINQGGVFAVPSAILPIGAVAEMKVLSNFQPEYGRNAGAVVNIVTKSGTNALHGELFEYFRNNALDARNWFNTTDQKRAPFHNNQFGGALGGPIVKDKTFFFMDYEGQRETVGTVTLACVPTGTGPGGSLSPNDASNQVIKNLLTNDNPWPAPNIAGRTSTDTGCPLGPNAALITPSYNNLSSVIGKIDHNFNQNNILTGRYFFGDSTQSFPLALTASGGQLPGFNTITPTRVQLVSLSYVHTIGTNKVNELRYGWNRFAEGFFPQDLSFHPTSIGLCAQSPAPDGSCPAVGGPHDSGLPILLVSTTPTGASFFAQPGATSGDSRARVDSNNQFIENFSWKAGKHDVKAGFEFRRTSVEQTFDKYFRGRLKFKTLSDFLAGNPTAGGLQYSGNSRRHTFENGYGLYLQDSFRVTPRVTLNYGLRWDYYGVIAEKNNLLSNFLVTNFDPASDTGTGNYLQVGQPGLSQLYQPDKKNFSPRASILWDLTGKGKTVIRVGGGIFYDAFSQDMFLGHLPYPAYYAPGPAYGNFGGAAAITGAALDPNTAANGITAGVPVYGPSDCIKQECDIFAVDPKLKTPYMENYNINIQQQLTNKTTLQVGYVGSQGHRLFRFYDISQPTQAAITAADCPNGIATCATTGAIQDFGVPRVFGYPAGSYYLFQEKSSGKSNYNSLQVSFKVNGWHGITSALNYVYSKSLDNSSDLEDFVVNAAQPQDSNRPNLEKGPSNFNIPQRLTWIFSYELPQMGGSMRGLKNGWGFDSTVSLQSGQPFTLNYNCEDDYSGGGDCFDRPDVVGPIVYHQHNPYNYLDLTAFAMPCTNNGTISGYASDCVPGTRHYGNLGRNSLVGPTYKQWDFALYKNTAIGEHVKVQMRAEFFNLLNHPNFSSPLLPAFIADPASNLGACGCGFQAGPNAREVGTTASNGGGYQLGATADVGVGNPFLGGGGPRGIQLALKFSF